MTTTMTLALPPMPRRCLNTRFGLLGAVVGRFAWASASMFLLLCILVPALLGWWLGVQLQIGLDAGFVPKEAPSHWEISMQKQFFNETQSREWYMALFGIARPPVENMLHLDYYNEFNNFYERITKKMVLSVPSDVDSVNFTYAQICHPLCEINKQMQKFMEMKYYSWFGMLTQMRYPVSRVWQHDVNIGKHVFNRTVDERGTLKSAQQIAFFFSSFIQNEQKAQQLEVFERTVAEEAAKHNQQLDTRVELIVHGMNTVQAQMERGVLDAALNTGIGFALGIFAFLVMHFFSGWLHSQFPVRRLLLAMLCLPLVPLVAFSAFSVLSALTCLSINLLHFTSPLLLFALLFTFHGTFQIGDAWCRLLIESRRKQFTASERLASTFEKIGIPFLQFQLAPIVAFGVLSLLLPAQHYRSMCAGISLMLAFCLCLQVFFFAPLLARLCHHHGGFLNGRALMMTGFGGGGNECGEIESKPSIAGHPPIIKLRAKNGHDLIPSVIVNGASSGAMVVSPKKAKRREQRATARRQLRTAFTRRIILPWDAFLHSAFGRFLLLAASIGLLWTAICHGVPQLRNTMDYRRLLPIESPALRGFDLMDSIWLDFLQIVYIVNRPPDFENPQQFGQFKEFISAATSLPNALDQPEAHMSWLFDYYRAQLNSNFFTQQQQQQHVAGNASATAEEEKERSAVDMSKFGQFITGFPYSAWQSGVHYTFHETGNLNQSHPVIQRMLVMIAYNRTRGLSGKRQLINECRQVAARFQQFQISVFDTDLRTTDIMDTIEPFVWRSIFGLFAAIFLISLPVFWHFGCSFLVLISSVSTFACFFGLGQLFGLELDLLTAPTAISIVPLCAQLACQFLGDLLACSSREDPFRHALGISVSALTKTSICWIAFCLPSLLLSKVPFFALQARLQALAVCLTLWHGIIVVPLLTSLLLTLAACCCQQRQHSAI